MCEVNGMKYLLLLPIISKQRRSAGESAAKWHAEELRVIKVVYTVIDVHALPVVRRTATLGADVGAMYFRPDLCKKNVNFPAHNVVTPSFIEAAEGLKLECGNAGGDARVLLVVALAVLHNLRAQLDGNGLLDHNVVEVDVVSHFGPGLSQRSASALDLACILLTGTYLQVGDPGMVI